MRREITEKIEVPEGIEVEIAGGKIKMKKGTQEAERAYEGFNAKIEGRTITLHFKEATKREKKLIKTTLAHLKNMLKGMDKKFVYKLQVCAVHFPMAITMDKTKNEMLIKNFLGEVKPRIAKLVKNVDVKIDKDIITVECHDKESAGQTAANIESAVRITNRDRRVFQDGIFITEKPE